MENVTKYATKDEYIAAIKTEMIKSELNDAGYDFAIAIATQAEIDAGAACGMLAIIGEN